MEQFEEAVDCYSKAIDLDGANATYFCNRYIHNCLSSIITIFTCTCHCITVCRAAAYIKMKQLEAALGDCTRAVSLDPIYARAHGRLGSVYIAPSLVCVVYSLLLEAVCVWLITFRLLTHTGISTMR